MTTKEWQITASSDDAECSNSTFRSTHVQLGLWDYLQHFRYGLRFINVNIPKGATINSAILTVCASHNSGIESKPATIRGYAANNLPTFSSCGDIDAAKTAAFIEWIALGAWIKDTWYSSPNIASIIQEIVNRSGWVSGNALGIFWDAPTPPNPDKAVWAYDHDPSLAIKLEITWTIRPSCRTDDATEVMESVATLNGTVLDDGGGESCQVRFQWGLTAAYGNNTEWQSGKITNDSVDQLIENLVLNTTYHFRIQVRNSVGTRNGLDRTFTTTIPPVPFIRRQLRGTIGQGGDISPTNPLLVQGTGLNTNPRRYEKENGFRSPVVARAGGVATLLWGIATVPARTAGQVSTMYSLMIENVTGAAVTAWLEIAGVAITVPFHIVNNDSIVIDFPAGFDLGDNDVNCNASVNGVNFQIVGTEA